MKAKIHPRYYQVEVRCVCGNVIKTGSTKKEFSISVCSKCHPFYTGAEKFVDSAGRVERFQKRFAWTGEKVKAEADKPKLKASKGVKPLSPVESRARGNRAKVAVGPAAVEGKKKEEPKAPEAAEPKAKIEAKPEAKKPETEPEAKKPETEPEAKKPETETKSEK